MTFTGFRWVLAAAVAAALAGALLVADYRAFLQRPLDMTGDSVRLEVWPGDSARTVFERMEDAGLTRAGWRWRLLLRLNPVTIQAGEYRLERGIRPAGVLRKLAAGDVIRYRFTIVEGWNYRQLRDALESDPVLLHEPGTLDPGVVMAHIGSERVHPEGWFLPETYAFVRGDTTLDVLRRAHLAMLEALEAAWRDRAPGLPLEKPAELLTLASIVEKETAVPGERAEVAGVFIRRLEQGWRLETDPSVIYGLGENWDGDIRFRDLRTDSPYNTYTRHGLPPTPIAMPGRDALRATARPAPGSAMFFVADGTGGHIFSDTLEEHNKAVRALLERQQNRP